MLNQEDIQRVLKTIAEEGQIAGLPPAEITAQQEHFRAGQRYRGLESSYGVKETTMAAINFTGNTTLKNLKWRYAVEINSKAKQDGLLEQMKDNCKLKCSIRMMGSEMPQYYDAVQQGREILIIKREDQFEIVCRNQKDYNLIRFTCSVALRRLLLQFGILKTDSFILDWEIYRTQCLFVYAEVRANQGYIQNDVVLDALKHYAPENLLTLCLWWCAARDLSPEITQLSTVGNRTRAFMLALENSVRGNNRNRSFWIKMADGKDKEFPDPLDNDDGKPNAPICQWGLQHQLAVCMQESHDAAHPDNVYIPNLAETIRAWLPNDAEAYYANSPRQAQIKASQVALAHAAAEHKTAERKYIVFFEKISQEIAVESLKAFYEKYGNPSSREDRELVNKLFREMRDNLYYVDFPEPTTGNADDLDVEFKSEAETKTAKELAEVESATSSHLRSQAFGQPNHFTFVDDSNSLWAQDFASNSTLNTLNVTTNRIGAAGAEALAISGTLRALGISSLIGGSELFEGLHVHIPSTTAETKVAAEVKIAAERTATIRSSASGISDNPVDDSDPRDPEPRYIIEPRDIIVHLINSNVDINRIIPGSLRSSIRRQAAMSYLLNLGFTQTMLNDFISNSVEGFYFKALHIHMLAYLVTGRHPTKPDVFLPIEALQPLEALAEIQGLNGAQLKALQALFKDGLTGDLLRSFHGPESFREQHWNTLVYLIHHRNPTFTAREAIDLIQGLTLEGIRRFMTQERTRSASIEPLTRTEPKVAAERTDSTSSSASGISSDIRSTLHLDLGSAAQITGPVLMPGPVLTSDAEIRNEGTIMSHSELQFSSNARGLIEVMPAPVVFMNHSRPASIENSAHVAAAELRNEGTIMSHSELQFSSPELFIRTETKVAAERTAATNSSSTFSPADMGESLRDILNFDWGSTVAMHTSPSRVQPLPMRFSINEVAITCLVVHGFTRTMLNDFIGNAGEGFYFKSSHICTLTYLVTGRHPNLPDHLFRIEPLQPLEALAEIRGLNSAQLKALDGFFKDGLTGELLRSFNRPEPFCAEHRGILEYLMHQSTFPCTAREAMDLIQEFPLEEIRRVIAQERLCFSRTVD